MFIEVELLSVSGDAPGAIVAILANNILYVVPQEDESGNRWTVIELISGDSFRSADSYESIKIQLAGLHNQQHGTTSIGAEDNVALGGLHWTYAQELAQSISRLNEHVETFHDQQRIDDIKNTLHKDIEQLWETLEAASKHPAGMTDNDLNYQALWEFLKEQLASEADISLIFQDPNKFGLPVDLIKYIKLLRNHMSYLEASFRATAGGQ